MQHTFFYQDELNDDFAGVSRKVKVIPDDYCYINHRFWFRVAEFIVYRIVMLPIAFLYCHFVLGMKIVNREILKECKKEGYFLYGNHTQIPGDGFLSALIPYPKKIGVLVHPDSVAQKGTENFMLMLGAMPLPSSMRGILNLENAMQERLKKGQSIIIFPEAHIWPYYTEIRPYTSVSFRYPVKWNKPVYCFTTTYRHSKYRKKPRMVVYVDGPFYSNQSLHPKKQQELLRNQVYEMMCKRAENSDTKYIQYIKKEPYGGENESSILR